MVHKGLQRCQGAEKAFNPVRGHLLPYTPHHCTPCAPDTTMCTTFTPSTLQFVQFVAQTDTCPGAGMLARPSTTPVSLSRGLCSVLFLFHSTQARFKMHLQLGRVSVRDPWFGRDEASRESGRLTFLTPQVFGICLALCSMPHYSTVGHGVGAH